MKVLKVVAAIIKNEDKILATKRGYGEFINLWEFPGGKIEDGETKEEALIREIKEELNVGIEIDKFALNIKYEYSTFFLDMDCFEVNLSKGECIELLEHSDARWLDRNSIDSVEWIPADIAAVDYIKENIF